MSDNFPKFILIIVSSMFFGLSLNSQVLPKQYNCYKTTIPVEIDGNVYDQHWNNVLWSDFFEDIEGELKPEPYLQTRMKMLWDNDYLYIAAELEDPDIWGYLSNHDDIIYRDNDFEVFIDPDGDGESYFEIEINAIGTILDLYMPKAYNKGGRADLAWNADNLKKAVKIYGNINDTLSHDNKWIVEMAIPWKAYGSRINNIEKPDDGETWRMNFSRVQWETEYCDNNYYKKVDTDNGKPLRESNWVWSPQGVINMHVPEEWGYVTFKEDEPVKSETIWTKSEYPRYWVWMGGGNKKSYNDWERIFRNLDDAGIKGFLLGADTLLLSKVISIANQYNISVHAWFWTMNRNDAKSEWLSFNQQGSSLAHEKAYVDYYKFMCPALPDVKEFISGKMDDLAMVDGLGGIHMDYIRYVDVILPIGLQPKYNLVQDHVMPEFDYGYHPYMRSLFKNEFGIDPVELSDPGNDNDWINFRLKELNKTVIGLRDHVRSKNLKVTAAVFPTPDMSANMVRQDWSNWNLDCYFPMVYHNFYNQPIEWIKTIMEENRAILGNNSEIFCGLYVPSLRNNKDLGKAIKAAMDGGADGVSFFSYGSLNSELIEQIKSFNGK
jgi:cellulose/xylan binding protein with CBM9 domain